MDLQVFQEAIESIKQTTDYFYQNKEHLAYVSLYHSIEWMTKAVEELGKSGSDQIGRINGLLSEVLAAMEAKDGIMIADLLNYEVLEVFQELLND